MNDRPVYPIFNLLSDVYDNNTFFPIAADRLILNAGIIPGQRVLDVACGTGWATIAAAKTVGKEGTVIGIDIADKMLDLARMKTRNEGLINVEYRSGDAMVLPFNEASFDVVIGAFSIFFLSDMLKALYEWRRVLKAGGTIGFSSFGTSFWNQPFLNLFSTLIARYEGQEPIVQPIPKQPQYRVDISEGCQELLKRAGFEKVEVITEQLGRYITDKNDLWRELMSTMNKMRLNRLNPDLQEKFKAEYFSQLESLCTEQGIWSDCPVIFSVAKKQ